MARQTLKIFKNLRLANFGCLHGRFSLKFLKSHKLQNNNCN